MLPLRGGGEDDLECAPLRSAHIQRNNYFYFAFVAACGPLQTLFHGRGRGGKWQVQRRFLRKRGAAGKHCQSAPSSGANAPPSPDRVKASAVTVQFPAKPQSFRACPLPLGGAVERSETEGLQIGGAGKNG